MQFTSRIRQLTLRLAASTLPFSLLGCSAAPGEPPSELARVQEAACSVPGDGSVTIYVSPGGSDTAAGTCSAPVGSLEGANRALRARYGYDTTRDASGKYSDTCQLSGKHTIYVRGGTYSDKSVDWDCTSPSDMTRIIAHPGERPVFDGLGRREYAFKLNKAELTRVELNGITWRHYVSYVIQFRGKYAVAENKTATEIARVTAIRNAGRNGRNIVTNNVFEENGDLYRTTCQNADEKPCTGFGVIDTFNSDLNTYSNNVFYRSENTEDEDVYPLADHSRHMMHALYLAMDSDSNIVTDNYIALTSGQPVKLRDGGDNNHIDRNYMTDSGSTGFVACVSEEDPAEKHYEFPCQNNQVTNNSFTFGYPWPDTYNTSSRVRNPVPAVEVNLEGGYYAPFTDPAFSVQSHVIHDGRRQSQENIGAVAVGDVRDIGTDQVVVALNYPGFHKIVATAGDGSRHLSRLLFASADDWSIDALAIGAFDSSGEQQLISAFNRPGAALLVRGDGDERFFSRPSSSIANLGPVYTNDNWQIRAIAAGDFDDSGRVELLTALESSGGTTRIYRGAGIDSIGSSIYESTYWDVSAMIAADLEGDGTHKLVTAFFHPTTNGGETRLYMGNGVTSATSGGYDFSSTELAITALTAGYPGAAGGPRLNFASVYTAFRPLNGSGNREIYRGSYNTPRLNRVYQSTTWDIAAMAMGELDPDRQDTLVTAFEWPSRNQIHGGNGISAATGLGQYHTFSQTAP